MHDQVHRVVEGAERQHHADGLVMRERQPAAGGWVDVHGDPATRTRAQQLDTLAHAIDGPVDLDLRVDERLSALASRLMSKLVTTALHELRGASEDLDSSRQGEPGIAIAIERVRSTERQLGHVLTPRLDLRNDRPVERCVDAGGARARLPAWHE